MTSYCYVRNCMQVRYTLTQVWPSVCHTCVLRQNDWADHRTFHHTIPHRHSRFNICAGKAQFTRKRGNSTWRPPNVAPVPIHFNHDAHAKFEVAQRIRCRLTTFSLLIRYVMLWPWPLILNICSILAAPWSNSVLSLSEIQQSAAELLQFEYWPYDLEHVPRACRDALRSG